MAKDRTPETIPMKANEESEVGTETFSIDTLFNAATVKESESGVYANHARFSITGNEIVVDFYLISSAFKKGEKPKSIHVKRVLLPVGLGKGFATGLANAIANFENTTGIEIPNQRDKLENDVIEIWK